MKKKRKNEELTARVRAELEALGLAEPAGEPAAEPAADVPPWENEDGSLYRRPPDGAAEPVPTPAEQLAAWQRQAEELRQLAPDFDLERESGDPAFRALLEKGLTVKQAFILQYFDRLLAAAAHLASREAERRLTADLRARGARPQENGTAGAGPFPLGDAAGSLTKKQRAEIADRVRRGETVRL